MTDATMEKRRGSNALVWIGAATVLIGVLLPWVKVQMAAGALGFSQSGTANGLDVNQGLLSLGVGILGAVLSFLAARGSLSPRITSITLLAIGVVIVGAAINAMGSGRVQVGGLGQGAGASISSEPMIGVYLTALGGVLLGLAGLTGLLRSRGG